MFFDDDVQKVEKEDDEIIEIKKPSNFSDKLLEHLNTKECELEDGNIVTNLDGICDMLIGKALNGDLQVIDLMNKLINK